MRAVHTHIHTHTRTIYCRTPLRTSSQSLVLTPKRARAVSGGGPRGGGRAQVPPQNRPVPEWHQPFRHFRRFRGSEERNSCFQWVECKFVILGRGQKHGLSKTRLVPPRNFGGSQRRLGVVSCSFSFFIGVVFKVKPSQRKFPLDNKNKHEDQILTPSNQVSNGNSY